MAFPIVPKYRSGAAGNPTSLNLGELAVNTHDGSLYLGADVGVVQIGVPIAAGAELTEWTANGTASQFAPINGYNGTDAQGYLVTVQGIDQPFTVISANGGTLVFDFTPSSGSLVRVRAITQGSGGGGGGGDATSIQGVAVSATTPTDGQALIYDGTAQEWVPTTLHGTMRWDDTQSISWTVPLGVQGYIRLKMRAGNGQAGGYGNLTNGADGKSCYFGTATAQKGWGGGGGATVGYSTAPGNNGNGPLAGVGGYQASGPAAGGWSGGTAYFAGPNGSQPRPGAGEPPYGGVGGSCGSDGPNWYGFAGGGGGGTSGGGGASNCYFWDGGEQYDYSGGNGGAGGFGEIVDIMYWVNAGETITGEIEGGWNDPDGGNTPYIEITW